MYQQRQLPYAPTPYSYTPTSSLSATISLDEEVKLLTTSAERELYESLAEIYSIIVTLDALEKAYLKDSVPESDYTETCSRLLKQYKSNLANETVAKAFVDLETFKREWDMDCSRATERLRVGIPATVEQPSHKPATQGNDAADATLVVSATENFITLLDAIKMGLLAKDVLHPLLGDIIQSVNRVTDKEFENKGKIIQWLITLNQMKAADQLSEDQAREFQFDMDQAIINPEGLTAYLTRIISSPLAWIPDDFVKEEIWEAASVRLSERSGRTAMPAMSRAFRIPLSKTTSVKIQIHEPSLTADNLGLKTWASSYLLAKRLHLLMEDDVALPLHGGAATQHGRGCSVLELGSGTGLVGIAAAAVLGTEVHLTDLPEIVENLDRNAVTNETLISNSGGQARTAMLDWTDPAVMEPPLQRDSQDTLQARYEVVLAADPLYSPEHPQLLVSAIKAQLVDDAAARVVIELPLRTAYQSTVEEFLDRMEALGLCIVREGYETGYDDWGELGGRRDVRCWWSVWGWKDKRSDIEVMAVNVSKS
ncbi:VPS28-domain-containing protein [Saccharata proteae CBS 121410]|uniref:VPS28-domain-containing protein n=1 Tax=Saccharata proteae CBS 121410 TaxID=1314787 RepID=A0A9P4LZN3_9PEZI|nr:VPS28-domain-containing protein [Saccharata proteae CBS 121410]